jgi:hypothetical protein
MYSKRCSAKVCEQTHKSLSLVTVWLAEALLATKALRPERETVSIGTSNTVNTMKGARQAMQHHVYDSRHARFTIECSIDEVP